MLSLLVLLCLLAFPTVSHADCDDPADDTCLHTEDHGDYAVGRHTNETWTDYYVRRDREIQRSK